MGEAQQNTGDQAQVSVVICTHNPKVDILRSCLRHLEAQDLDKRLWELIVVDNASDTAVADWIAGECRLAVKVVREEKLGLSNARLAGMSHATAGLIVFVDDDNLLDASYLREALSFSKSNSRVGCFSGKSIASYEEEPPAWFRDAGLKLGCQDYGNHAFVFSADAGVLKAYPEKGPTGTGMVIVKQAFADYLREVQSNPGRLKLGRTGKSLASGEDNDIVLCLLKSGWQVAYVPSLVVTHIIPATRLKLDYLTRMAFESNRSWVKVLHLHGICPWKRISRWTLPLRKLKALASNRAWAGPKNMIRWRAACGTFQGLAEIP